MVMIGVFAIVLFTLPSQARAKGSPDLIVIEGIGASKPIEITDRATLKSFDPWNGQFIDWTRGAISRPSNPDRCFDVSFFMKWPARHSKYDRGQLKLIYSLKYCTGEAGSSGVIYLPDHGDLFSINSSTILREGDDGKWHRAAPAWEERINKLFNGFAQNSESHPQQRPCKKRRYQRLHPRGVSVSSQ
jgi:hypothetical protein